ncbi:putative extracellular nuclease [Halospina denitrificans]|uniref:Putative extracellular nuclease n=1 Tax=Halospina denitrificans TaxID=332522 RepID=A0A4R7K1E8_9GAMM|nr:ExeM/NucH family extracellular endonuclease [Halospina denitrificans]TDT44174.1 putative extracellular nuclease [Halospina denitrificans]
MKKNRKRLGVPAVIGAVAGFYLLSFLFWPLPDAAESGCRATTTPITDVQGRTGVTPMDGERVLIRGVVSGDFTGEEELGGFFVQQEGVGASDSGEASSGLFVYAPGMEVSPGERLLLDGEAGEYYGMTQISDVRLRARCGRGEEVAPVTVKLPLTERERHRLQGMKLRLEPPLAVTGLYELGRYGVVAVADERLYTPTQVHRPGTKARQQAAENQQRLLRIDDGSKRRDPALPGWVSDVFGAGQSLRVGDQLAAVEGILDYRYEHWRLQPLEPPSVRTANARPEPLVRPPENRIRVASFNLQNYFNGDGHGGGFPTERGASEPEAFERQHLRLVNAIAALAADVIGVIEVENDGYGRDSALAELTGGLEGDWDYARPERQRLGSDAIAVGMLYRAERVQPLGQAHTLLNGPFAHYNRPPLAQRFRHLGTGATFWVVVNHFKSKRCGGAVDANRAQDDGQGCWNPLRVKAANRLVEWVEVLAADHGDDRVLLLGDFNAYAREDPMVHLREAGFRNVLSGHRPLPASGYIYRAESGTLDYILATGALKDSIQRAGVFPINADEPPLLYYDRENRHDVPTSIIQDGDPWRSSDHDPTWVDIDLGAPDGN